MMKIENWNYLYLLILWSILTELYNLPVSIIMHLLLQAVVNNLIVHFWDIQKIPLNKQHEIAVLLPKTINPLTLTSLPSVSTNAKLYHLDIGL